jgi:hypothetical protein
MQNLAPSRKKKLKLKWKNVRIEFKNDYEFIIVEVFT